MTMYPIPVSSLTPICFLIFRLSLLLCSQCHTVSFTICSKFPMQIEIAENAHHTKMYRNLHWRIYFYGQYHLYWSSGLTRNSRNIHCNPLKPSISCLSFAVLDLFHMMTHIWFLPSWLYVLIYQVLWCCCCCFFVCAQFV